MPHDSKAQAQLPNCNALQYNLPLSMGIPRLEKKTLQRNKVLKRSSCYSESGHTCLCRHWEEIMRKI